MEKGKNIREIFNKYANDYHARYMDVELYADFLDLFCEYVKVKDAEILEIGCGPGNITKYLLSKRPDFNILGIDIAENMIRLSRKNNPDAQFQVMDCRNIRSIDKKYDAVICGFCLPYLDLKETEELIEKLSKMMDQDAMLYLSTMEASPELSGYETSSNSVEKLYINYYDSRFLKKLLEQNSFRILRSSLIKNPSNREPVKDLVILAEKV